MIKAHRAPSRLHPFFSKLSQCPRGSPKSLNHSKFSLKTRHQLGNCRAPGPWSLINLQRRRTFLGAVPGVLVPPVVFVGLVLTLWFYKCLMMVIFQNKIIYMPSLPPFARQEKICDYVSACTPVVWREEFIKSLDGTRLALCIGSMSKASNVMPSTDLRQRKHVVILYFQGNASSMPPRLPMLSRVLKSLQTSEENIDCTMVALSYRGFWKSSGRASQAGIEQDALATLRWISTFSASLDATHFVIWGQSIGAGVATFSAANVASSSRIGTSPVLSPKLDGLILETPFKSIRSMLISLYPQKWLPYRYLGPFLRNWWDNENELRSISQQAHRPEVLILNAENDELVPPEHGKDLVRLCNQLSLKTSASQIRSALHTEVLLRGQGRQTISEFLLHITQR